MKRIIISTALLFSSVVVAKPTTVLVSIDGFANYYLQKYQVPFIKRLANLGVTADAMLPVYPSKTFPNHISMVTGVYPSKHGIVHNKFYHPEIGKHYKLGAGKDDKRWLTAKPIWTYAEEQNNRAYLYFWPESESISHEVRASHIEPYVHERENGKRVSKVLDWICAEKKLRPDFVSLYFSTVDSAGHEYGQDSKQLIFALDDVNEQLERLVGESEKCNPDGVNFVIVSDHGMTKAGAENAIYPEDIIDTESVQVVNGQTQLFIYEKDDRKLNDVRSQLMAFKSSLSKTTFRIYHRNEYPKHWRLNVDSVLVPDLIVDAVAPYTFAKKGKKVSVETHGFDAKYNEDLHAIFIGYGPAFKAGESIGAFENVHVASLIAHLMGIKLPNDLDSKLEVFKPILKN